MPTKNFDILDGNVRLELTWDRGQTNFSGIMNPAADRIRFNGTSPYVNEQRIIENDNGVGLVYFPDGSYFRVRILYTERNDGTIFSAAGDVISCYGPKNGNEHSWVHLGNILV